MPVMGSWYGEKIKDGSDMVMFDLLYPYWPESTYFACWNINMYPHGGYFYAGVAANTPNEAEEKEYRPNTVWSFWSAGVYEGRQVRNTYMNPQVYAQQYIGEGASGNAGGRKVSWILPKQWYTMCIKTWGADEEKKESFVGWWMKDKTNNEWHHIATFKIPYAATGFTGNGGFLEDFGHAGRKHREIWHGAGYTRHDGKWEKCNKVHIDVPKETGMLYSGWMVNHSEDKSYLTISYTENKQFERNLEPGQKHFFEINQPELPTFAPLTATADAQQKGSGLIINWSLDAHSSPQLGYKVELFDNESLQGAPFYSLREDLPQARTKSITLPKDSPCWVKFTIIDIFDQQKEFTISPDAPETTVKSQSSLSTDAGLEYSYTEETGACEKLADIDFDSAKQSGISHGLDIALRGDRNDKFAFEYKGYLMVPKTGAYTFILKSCDGSLLKLDGQTIIDNDGVHSASEVRKSVFLQKGYIPFELAYFRKDGGSQYTSLWLGWEHNNKPLEEIPLTHLLRKKTPNTPSAKLSIAPARNGSLPIKTVTNAMQIKKIEYYNGSRHITTSDKAPFATNIIPFEGENSFWARIYYANNQTIDSPHVSVTGTSRTAPGWNYMNRSEPGLSYTHGFDPKSRALSFTGEGEYLINRQVKGDFDLMAKVRSISPDNMDVCPDNWVGLMVASDNNSRSYDKEVAIFRTVARGLRASADFSDLGTSRMSSFSFDRSHTWLKISRRGNRFICYSSPDGKQWTPGLERIVPMKDEVYAGVTFRTIPNKGRGLFHASIEQISLKPVSETRAKPSFPLPSGKVIGYSFLKSDLLAIRYKNGVSLLSSKDNTYKEAPLKLPKAVKWVRSMTMSEDNIYLAASTPSAESDLYVSRDMGKNWENIAPGFRVNPDPAYSISGEILAINPANAREIYAGSYKGGVYVSRDGGDTWSNEKLMGECITNIVCHPVVQGRICITTADPDSGVSKVYLSKDNAANWDKRVETPSVAFLRMVFDSRHTDMIYILASDGIYGSFNDCHSMNKCLHVVDYNTPYLAADLRRKDVSYIFTAPFSGRAIYNTDKEWRHWKKTSDDGKWGNIFDFKISPDDFDHVTMYTGTGIYTSRDAGKTWTPVHKI